MADPIHTAVLIPGHKIFGQERALLNLAESLRRGSMRVTILLHSEFGRDYLAPTVRERGFPFYFLPMNTIWSPGLLLRQPADLVRNIVRVRSASQAISRLMTSESIDAVVTGNWAFATYILPALESSDVAFVYRHGDAPPLSNPLVRALTKRVFARANVHVVNCAYLEGRLRDFCEVGEVRIIRNAALGLERAPLCISGAQEARRIVYAGQLSEHKGVLVLLDAFEIVARAHGSATLTLAGAHPGVGSEADPRIVARLEKAKADWGDRVIYLGHVASVPPLFTDDAVHVCPSIWDEPSPNVIPEAKTQATPTVAFARGGIPEIIRSGIDGEIVKEETAEALAAALMSLLASPEHFAREKQAARESLSLLPDEQELTKLWTGAVRDAVAIRQRTRLAEAS